MNVNGELACQSSALLSLVLARVSGRTRAGGGGGGGVFCLCPAGGNNFYHPLDPQLLSFLLRHDLLHGDEVACARGWPARCGV